MKICIRLMFLVLIILSGLTSCVKNSSNNQCITPQSGELGNTNGNLNNGGAFVEKAGIIYFSDTYASYRPDGNYLLKMNADGSDKSILADDFRSGLNVIGEWIYYIAVDDNRDIIMKVRTDGKEKQRIGKMLFFDETSFFVVGNRMYFANFDGDIKTEEINYLRSFTLDGNCELQLTPDNALYANFEGEWIIYSNLTDNGFELIKINFDKSQIKSLVTIPEGFQFFVYNGWIYYNSFADNRSYRIDMNGENKTKLSELWIQKINAKDDRLYYLLQEDGTLMASHLDGSQAVVLKKEFSDFIHLSIAGEWIYGTKEAKIVRIRLDGTGYEIFD